MIENNNLSNEALPEGATPADIFNHWNRERPMPWGLPKPPDMIPEKESTQTGQGTGLVNLEGQCSTLGLPLLSAVNDIEGDSLTHKVTEKLGKDLAEDDKKPNRETDIFVSPVIPIDNMGGTLARGRNRDQTRFYTTG